ncbi:MAG: hypothetical protein M1830_008620 [Pleopsidium flavum]|nr:MAG: hypothetical protein M1830_008620 [Pleopsidium flavum]
MKARQGARQGGTSSLLSKNSKGHWTEPAADVEASLDRLSLSNAHKHPTENRAPVADSWEDDLSSGEDTEKDERRGGIDIPKAPPPTPVSPTFSSSWSETDSTCPYSPSRSSDGGSPSRPNFRPEKQTAVAGRLIAGALGVRTPKKNEEQRAYDKAMKDKETKRRNKEREAQARAKQDADRAKAAVWDE